MQAVRSRSREKQRCMVRRILVDYRTLDHMVHPYAHLLRIEVVSMAKHPLVLKGYSDLQEAAEEVENLRYDKVVEFLGHLSQALDRRAASDRASGRPVLARQLERASYKVMRASVEMAEAWSICRSKMRTK